MFTLPDLPYDYTALEPYIDAATMKVHHDGHHATYVKNLNDLLTVNPGYENLTLEQILEHIDSFPDAIRAKIRNNTGGVYNHNLYWTMMTPKKNTIPSPKLMNALVNSFLNFPAFLAKFNEAALSHFGSGWVWLVQLKHGLLTIIPTLNQDSPVSMGHRVLLGIDVWEHAYYLKHQNKRVDYIKDWWNVANWEEVSKRLLL